MGVRRKGPYTPRMVTIQPSFKAPLSGREGFRDGRREADGEKVVVGECSHRLVLPRTSLRSIRSVFSLRSNNLFYFFFFLSASRIPKSSFLLFIFFHMFCGYSSFAFNFFDDLRGDAGLNCIILVLLSGFLSGYYIN